MFLFTIMVIFTQCITSTKMSLFTGNHVEKNGRCCDSIRCCAIATMDYGTDLDPIPSFGGTHHLLLALAGNPPLVDCPVSWNPLLFDCTAWNPLLLGCVGWNSLLIGSAGWNSLLIGSAGWNPPPVGLSIHVKIIKIMTFANPKLSPLM